MTRIFRRETLAAIGPGIAPAQCEPVPYDPEMFGDDMITDRAAFRRSIRIAPGDVLLTIYGDGFRKIRVVVILIERPYYGDSLIARFRCQFETKAGTWSQQWSDVYPGYVERAYERARAAAQAIALASPNA